MNDFDPPPSFWAEVPQVFKDHGKGVHVCRIINTMLKSMNTQQQDFEKTGQLNCILLDNLEKEILVKFEDWYKMDARKEVSKKRSEATN